MVLLTRYRLGRCADFDDQYVKNVVSRKDVPFGGPKNNFVHFDPIFAKKRKFLVDFRQDKISAQYGFNIGDFVSKHPLNDHLRFWKLDDE